MFKLVLEVLAGFFAFFKPTPPARKLRKKIGNALKEMSERRARRRVLDELRESSDRREDPSKGAEDGEDSPS